MRHRKRRKLRTDLFSKSLETTSGDPTPLEKLASKAQSAKKLRVDFGFSSVLSGKEDSELVQAIAEDRAELPSKESLADRWPFWLNLACALGSQKSATYILNKADQLDEGPYSAMPSSTNNTALCYAAASGNKSLCYQLMKEPYFCKVDTGVLTYAPLGDDLNFVFELNDLSNSSNALLPK